MLKLNYERGKFSSYIKTRARLDTIAKAKGGGNGSLPWQKYKPFYIVDLGINYKINKQSSLSFAVQNLLIKISLIRKLQDGMGLILLDMQIAIKII